MTRKLPDALADLVPRGRGRRFFRAVLDDFEVGADAFELVSECARMCDELDQLALIVASDGLMVTTDKGDIRVHPAEVERRLLRGELRLALTRLGFPDDAGDVPTVRRARNAANARWSP
ncbi:hypothetical protein BH23ACT4_BH23ACT4_03610 [soil metagenome]